MKKSLLAVLLVFFAFQALWASDSGDFYRLAEKQYYENHYSNAEENLNSAINLDKGNWKAHQLLAYCHYMKKDYDLCLNECYTSLMYQGDNPRLAAFADRLKAKTSGEAITHRDSDAFFEGKDQAAMPPPPDLDGERKPDQYSKDEPVLAQDHPNEGRGIFLYPGIGLPLPLSPSNFSQNWTPAFSLGLGVGFGLNQGLSILIDGLYNSFSLQGPVDGLSTSGGSITDITLLVNLKAEALAGGTFSPYVIGGLGPAFYSVADATFTGLAPGFPPAKTVITAYGMSNVDLAGRLGVGFDCKANSGTYLFFEVDYIFTNDTLVDLDYGIARIGVKNQLN